MPPAPPSLAWPEIEALVAQLAEQVRASSFAPTALCAIPRGGWCVAALLAQHLGVKKTLSVDLEATANGKIIWPSSLAPQMKGQQLLLVEDALDTGQTVFAAQKILAGEGLQETRIAALFLSPRCLAVPDYFLEKRDELPLFPWNFS